MSLAALRDAGWVVAAHNDYQQNGVPHTFWLLTRDNHECVKGEGITDSAALAQIVYQLEARYAEGDQKPSEPVGMDHERLAEALYLADAHLHRPTDRCYPWSENHDKDQHQFRVAADEIIRLLAVPATKEAAEAHDG